MASNSNSRRRSACSDDSEDYDELSPAASLCGSDASYDMCSPSKSHEGNSPPLIEQVVESLETNLHISQASDYDEEVPLYATLELDAADVLLTIERENQDLLALLTHQAVAPSPLSSVCSNTQEHENSPLPILRFDENDNVHMRPTAQLENQFALAIARDTERLK